MTTTYGIEIQRRWMPDEYDDGWQTLHSEEIVTDEPAADLARRIAETQTIATGNDWRVRVWTGFDRNSPTEVAAEFHASWVGREPAVYVVEVQAGNDDATDWWAAAPAGTVRAYGGETAQQIGELVANAPSPARGSVWRVVVWEGERGDNSHAAAVVEQP